MNRIPKISDTEWEVMKVLWNVSPLTANQVIDSFKGKFDWSPKTVRTLLNRLVTKGAITCEKEKQYVFYPAVKENECKMEERKTFLKRVYNGAFNVMLTNFLDEQKLSNNEIEELKRILEEKKK